MCQTAQAVRIGLRQLPVLNHTPMNGIVWNRVVVHPATELPTMRRTAAKVRKCDQVRWVVEYLRYSARVSLKLGLIFIMNRKTRKPHHISLKFALKAQCMPFFVVVSIAFKSAYD